MQFTVYLVNRGRVVDLADRDSLEVFAEHVPRTATEREYQVGVNVLRPKGDVDDGAGAEGDAGRALLYEVVSEETDEEDIARRRR